MSKPTKASSRKEPESEAVTCHGPGNVSGMSIFGIEYAVEDGVVELPGEAVAEAAAFGFKPANG